MQGTEKQIEWATEIKSAATSVIEQALAESIEWLNENRDGHEKLPQFIEAVTTKATSMIAENDAKKWIDMRVQFATNNAAMNIRVNHLIPACRSVK